MDSRRRIEVALENLVEKRICVVGDLIVDKYRIMKASRLSAEAPVVIFEQESEEFRPGGAANVIANLNALGVGRVKLISVIGNKNITMNDLSMGVNSVIPCNSILAFEDDRLTTIKERICTIRQQICRIDEQSDKPILNETAEILFNAAREELERADAIIFSDYAHGVCTPELVSPILNLANKLGIPTIVDSKAKDTLLKYKGSTVALPNMDEARVMTKLDSDFEDEHVAKFLMKSMNLKAAAVTLGPRGILLHTDTRCEIFPPLQQNPEIEVVDVTGAGDTVAATVAAGLTLGMPYDKVMRLANVTAGIKVRKRGVATASPAEILEAITYHKLDI